MEYLDAVVSEVVEHIPAIKNRELFMLHLQPRRLFLKSFSFGKGVLLLFFPVLIVRAEALYLAKSRSNGTSAEVGPKKDLSA
jgi:hypothetical protein